MICKWHKWAKAGPRKPHAHKLPTPSVRPSVRHAQLPPLGFRERDARPSRKHQSSWRRSHSLHAESSELFALVLCSRKVSSLQLAAPLAQWQSHRTWGPCVRLCDAHSLTLRLFEFTVSSNSVFDSVCCWVRQLREINPTPSTSQVVQFRLFEFTFESSMRPISSQCCLGGNLFTSCL